MSHENPIPGSQRAVECGDAPGTSDALRANAPVCDEGGFRRSIESLAGWVKEEVERLNWSSECVERGWPAFASRRATRLSVIALADLLGIQGSEQIARACREETSLRALCAGQGPSASELDQSRLEYPTQLVTVLRNVLARVVPDWSLFSPTNGFFDKGIPIPIRVKGGATSA